MKRGISPIAVLVILMTFVLAAPGAGWALESHPLLDDSALQCTGPAVGKVFMQTLGTKVLVLWNITNGGASVTRQLFWNCQSGTGCHSGCGFESVGTITTNSSGKARKFAVVSPPFAGPMHWDICPGTTACSGPNLWSGIFTTPFVSAGASGGTGDAAAK